MPPSSLRSDATASVSSARRRRSFRKRSGVARMPQLRARSILGRNPRTKESTMNTGPILIGYDDSDGSRRAIQKAAELFGKRRAIVLDVAPAITSAETFATLNPVVPGNAFEELNATAALERAQLGAERARRAGFDADARAEIAPSTWEGIVDVADEID